MFAVTISSAQSHDVRLCGRPEVLMFAAQHLRRAEPNVYLVEAAAAVEMPLSHVTLCAVTVRVRLHDPADDCDQSSVISEARYFEVRQLAGGIEVDFTGK